MIRIIELFNLCDSYRLKHPLHEKGHTYVNPAKSGTGSRIDYIFVADIISQYINKCEVITSPAPDHKALILEIVFKRQKKVPSYWKINVTVLEEREYNNGIDKIIETQSKLIQECPKGEKRYAWDIMKIKIREFTQKYCQIRNTKKKIF